MKSQITCTRRVEFDAAHRVVGHENKCRFLHGHRYVLEVTFSNETLDKVGRVIDFGEAKNRIKNWVDSNFDHTTILSTEDKNLGDEISKVTNQKIYYLNNNPTAENIAAHLLSDILPKIFSCTSIKIVNVRLFETPNCYVDAQVAD